MSLESRGGLAAIRRRRDLIVSSQAYDEFTADVVADLNALLDAVDRGPSRLRVVTASGSVYVLDRRDMTWSRVNPRGWAGRSDRASEMDRSTRLLDPFPMPVVGQSMIYHVDVNGESRQVISTPVIRVDDLS